MKATARRYFLKAFIIFLIMGAAALAMTQFEDRHVAGAKLPIEEIVIETAAGKKIVLQLEVARKPMDLEIGLMYRDKLGERYGMIFLMGKEPRVTSFWMKNTLIPLDMIFVAADGKIVNIHHKATPQSLTPVSSREAVVAVIEIDGGATQELGIGIGDRVAYGYFQGMP